jgi:hypothetical protein
VKHDEREAGEHEEAERESTEEHEGAVREQARAEGEQMYKTVVSAKAKRRRISQQKITSCVKIGVYVYIYIWGLKRTT